MDLAKINSRTCIIWRGSGRCALQPSVVLGNKEVICSQMHTGMAVISCDIISEVYGSRALPILRPMHLIWLYTVLENISTIFPALLELNVV